MALNLPEVQPVTLRLKDEPNVKPAEVDVSNDYGTPNLLFLYYVPFLPDDKKPDLDAIRDEFQTWNAWELGQAEIQLRKHVEDGNLPSDDSLASRVIRNNYRSKAIDFFRSTSESWLTVANVSRDEKSVATTQEDALGDVRRTLRTIAASHKLQAQFGVILNALSGRITFDKETKMHFTHVYYKYDGHSKRFWPVIQDTTFGINKEEDDGNKGSKDTFTVSVNVIVNTYNFDRKFWRDNRHEGEAAIRKGEPIRKEMAWDFYVDN